MGNLEALLGGVVGYTATALVAPYAATLVYAAVTGAGVAIGYNANFKKSGKPTH